MVTEARRKTDRVGYGFTLERRRSLQIVRGEVGTFGEIFVTYNFLYRCTFRKWLLLQPASLTIDLLQIDQFRADNNIATENANNIAFEIVIDRSIHQITLRICSRPSIGRSIEGKCDANRVSPFLIVGVGLSIASFGWCRAWLLLP